MRSQADQADGNDGCRLYPYASTDEALADMLRLSRDMTQKYAAAASA